MLVPLTAGVGVFVDTNGDVPYKLHFFEMAVKGQNTKGEVQTLLGELVAVREELSSAEERFSIIPADTFARPAGGTLRVRRIWSQKTLRLQPTSSRARTRLSVAVSANRNGNTHPGLP